MLSRVHNSSLLREAKQRRSLTLRVSYTKELVHQLNSALRFVIHKIGFQPLHEIHVGHEPGNNLILNDSGGNVLTVELLLLETNDKVNSIIFHTDDCLRDYHKYIIAGIEFTSRPEYNSAGLQVNFMDNAENRYTLLEERTYTES